MKQWNNEAERVNELQGIVKGVIMRNYKGKLSDDEYDDALQAGLEAAIKHEPRWNPELGAKFGSFIWRHAWKAIQYQRQKRHVVYAIDYGPGPKRNQQYVGMSFSGSQPTADDGQSIIDLSADVRAVDAEEQLDRKLLIEKLCSMESLSGLERRAVRECLHGNHEDNTGIGNALGLSRETVRTALLRATRKLKEAMG